MSREHSSTKEAMTLSARRDAEAAAAEREAANARLAESRAALEAEQNRVKAIEVTSKLVLSIAPTLVLHQSYAE